MPDSKTPQSRNKRLYPIWTACGVACLLLVLFLQLALSVRQESIGWDEGDHLFSGYMSWKHGDFGLNPEHPPLVKLVAAIPLLSMQLRVPELQNRQFKLEAFLDGKNFAAWNYGKGILFRARMAVSVFALLLALLIFWAAREMFGVAAGFIALILFVFDPNSLAHGALVTTDVGVSCFLFGSIYCFYRYVKAPSFKRLLIAGCVTGLAFSSKHTGILLLPMLLALVLCEGLRRDSSGQRARNLARLVGAFVLTVSLSASLCCGPFTDSVTARAPRACP
jgi:4-amino-4-deoxy-L-arabinose transferase-like glycosyltransferase